jgi:hypothetical protein
MKDAIKALLSRTDTTGAIAVTTAIVRLYARQTSDEQSRGTTVEQNGRGFNAFHAKDGSYMACYALGATRFCPKGVVTPEGWDKEVAKLKRGEKSPIRIINGRFLDKARKIALFYIAQLVAEAEMKKAMCELSERRAIQEESCDSSDLIYPDSGVSCPPTLQSERGNVGAVTMRP